MQGFRDRVQQNRRIQRRMATCFCVALFILLVSLSAFFVLQFEPVQRKYFYVYPYHDTVMKYAEIYHVDSNLTAAVIKSESKFKHTALSHRGAVGLMQLMPDTAAWIADKLGETGYNFELLLDPETNIRFGTWYLASLISRCEDSALLGFFSYNAGITRVRR